MNGGHHLCILGAGAWGTALAHCWAHCGAGNQLSGAPRFESVSLIARTQTQADDIGHAGENQRYLPGQKLAKNLHVTGNLKALKAATHVACVTPAQGFADLSKTIAPLLPQTTTLLLCSKGIDAASGRTMSQIAEANLPGRPVAVLSGPSFAHDVVRNLPTAVTLAHRDGEDAAMALAQLFSTQFLRIYPTGDVVGVEAGGALKNIFAIAVGVARGLELGASAEAALTARGFAELTRLAVAMGGGAQTLSGLSGLGDLILTCASTQSRNFAYGVALARDEVTPDLPLAEGAKSAQAALKLARDKDIDVPIIEAVSNLIAGALSPLEAVDALLSRPLRSETSS
ncbi:MAG: NAD(P)H-dependent glycerol-3-phosphate dehydrogenase [Pseudomonadota bacterium]